MSCTNQDVIYGLSIYPISYVATRRLIDMKLKTFEDHCESPGSGLTHYFRRIFGENLMDSLAGSLRIVLRSRIPDDVSHSAKLNEKKPR